MFDAAFPKVFAGLAGRRLKAVRVLVVVLVAHSQHEVFPFEVDLRDPRPEVVANLENILNVYLMSKVKNFQFGQLTLVLWHIRQ